METWNEKRLKNAALILATPENECSECLQRKPTGDYFLIRQTPRCLSHQHCLRLTSTFAPTPISPPAPSIQNLNRNKRVYIPYEELHCRPEP